jgi:2-polyprenyl-3-methyl-5-hydroxy-6-metoxy-1,4-benzoquinol methylase
MKLSQLKENWDAWARKDPLWAICSDRSDWSRDEFFASGIVEIEEVIQHLESLGVDILYGKALDFGCGIGRLTQALARYFEKSYGVDISPHMIDMAKQANTYGEECEYILNDKEELSIFDNELFDLIYCSRVLQHIEPKYSMSYMREFIRLLKPNGLLVFQLPAEQFGYKKWLKALLPISIVNFLRRIVYRSSAVAEMYTIDKEVVIHSIECDGGKVIDVVQNQAAGTDYISLQYYIAK